MIISVPTGQLKCSAPLEKVAPVVLRNIVVSMLVESKDVLFSYLSLQMLLGYVPESIKKLGSFCNQLQLKDRDLASLFSFRACHVS